MSAASSLAALARVPIRRRLLRPGRKRRPVHGHVVSAFAFGSAFGSGVMSVASQKTPSGILETGVCGCPSGPVGFACPRKCYRLGGRLPLRLRRLVLAWVVSVPSRCLTR